MSDNKRRKKQPKSDSKKRSSFDERVCDDLCEVLLQYLPFEDKFKLECVSKQFQRNVFNRQYELLMDYQLRRRLKKDCSRKRMAFIETAFETILKKCPNIKTITVNNFDHFKSNHWSFGNEYNKIMDIIIKNCDHLKEFEVYVNKLRQNTIDNFCQKFATKLSSIRLLNSNELFDRQLLTSLSNITELSLNSYMPFGLSHVFNDQNQCLAKNLRRLSVKYDSKHFKQFEAVIESNPRLEILDIICFNRDELSLCQLLSIISNFPDLKQLNLRTTFYLIDNSFAKSLQVLAEKCPKVCKIKMPLIYFSGDNESHKLFLEVIDSLKHFKNLKRIDISVDCVSYPTLLTAQHLSVCKRLTHLSLFSYPMNDEFFKDIGALLPGLKFLYILNSNITKSTLKELSQLKHIEELEFDPIYSMAKLNEESVAQMYVKCPKLKSIKFIHKSFY